MPTAEDTIRELQKQLREVQINAITDPAQREALEKRFENEDSAAQNAALIEVAGGIVKKEKATTLATELGVSVEELMKAKTPEEMDALALRLVSSKLKEPPPKPDEEKSPPKAPTTDITGGGPEPLDYKPYQGSDNGLAVLWTDLKASGKFYNAEVAKE